MKKLLLIATMLLSINCFSQDSTKITTKQVYEDVKRGFSALVSNLQGPAKHIYGIYVYQARAEGIANAICSFLVFIIGIILILIVYKPLCVEGTDNEGQIFIFILGCFLLVIGVVAIVCFFSGDGFTKVINPEYFAIKDIISAFK